MRTLILPILLLSTLAAFAAAPLTFEEVDTDGDGLISADEAANVEGLDFNAADTDNDGTLSVDEYDIAVEKLSQPAAAPSAEPASSSVVKTPVPAAPKSSPAATTPAPAAMTPTPVAPPPKPSPAATAPAPAAPSKP